jgi:hypothetical protein
MRNYKFLAVLILMSAVIFSCSSEKKENQFVLDGTIKGVKSGEIYLVNESMGIKDTAHIKEGKFTFSSKLVEPSMMILEYGKEGEDYVSFYAENTAMTLVCSKDSLENAMISGCNLQDELTRYKVDYSKTVKYDYSEEELEKLFVEAETSKEAEEKLVKIMMEVQAKAKAFDEKWMKENPTSPYTLEMLLRGTKGKSVEDARKILDALDPAFQDNIKVINLRKKLEKIELNEVNYGDYIKASNVAYKVDKSFDGKSFTDVVYLCSLKNNNICALKENGVVQIVSNTGKLVKKFEINTGSKTTAIASDDMNHIYLLSTKTIKKEVKVRGKIHVQESAVGVVCTILGVNGQKVNSYELEGLKAASGVKIVDDRLIVSDYSTSKVAIYDLANAELLSEVNGMRPCCGILDFAINKKNELLVANLGAFRVQAFDMTGKSLLTFGKRGKELDSFHGCCNPVSVACLNSGAIVTVEKDPTRIKVYSKEGAKQIEGIEELVKGCSYIPMVVDDKDNLYLASPKKGIVKCTSV